MINQIQISNSTVFNRYPKHFKLASDYFKLSKGDFNILSFVVAFKSSNVDNTTSFSIQQIYFKFRAL